MSLGDVLIVGIILIALKRCFKHLGKCKRCKGCMHSGERS